MFLIRGKKYLDHQLPTTDFLKESGKSQIYIKICSFSKTHAQGHINQYSRREQLPSTNEPSLPLQTLFYRQNSLGFCFTLWAARDILVWGQKRGRGGKMQSEFLQMSGRVVPGQLGLKPCTRGGAPAWLGRMWAQPHLVSFNARSKRPDLLHSFSMSYIKSDY